MNMLNEFEQSVLRTVDKFNMISRGDSIVVGVSGGADSVALLMFLCSIREEMNLTITAVHINHGIRGSEAQRDEDYVVDLCNRYSVDCIVRHCNIIAIAEEEKISHELAGRRERYNAFYDVAKNINADKIAVAHNKNDSAETILIKMTRGCSLNGLRGIAPVNGVVIRPLIDTPRSFIEAYLNLKNIDFMTDSTNKENIYTRNIIRNTVIPEFEKINSSFINVLCSNASTIACDDDFIEECAKVHYDKCIGTDEDSVVLDMNAIADLHIALKKRIILYAFCKLKGDKNDIEQKHIDILLHSEGTGKQYHIGKGIIVSSEYGCLIFKKSDNTVFGEYETEIDSVYATSHEIAGRRINFDVIDNNVLREKNCIYVDYDKLVSGKLTVRNRRDGDRFVPSGMKGEKKLKKFFIDLKVPRHIRDSVPILCIDNRIVAVLGYRVSNDYIVSKNTKKVLKISIFE